MIVFIISCIVGLQSCNRLRAVIIIWVITGASVAVSGEVHFKWAGFILQAVSQLAECSRMVMGEIVLSGRKLDPLTYTLFLAPICMIVLVIGNACVAFLLNVLVAAVIKECSAVGFVLCGLTKDCVIVIFSAVAFSEEVTTKQAIGFAVTLAGVFFWSYCKTYPQSAVVTNIQKMLWMPLEEPGESDPLIKDAAAK